MSISKGSNKKSGGYIIWLNIFRHVLMNIYILSKYRWYNLNIYILGIGIGLNMCQKFCEVLGPSNDITLISNENQGTKFIF